MKESNTLIANFLGLELQEDNTYFDYESCEYINQEDLIYDKSWDMLMLVVTHIERNLPDEFFVVILEEECNIYQKYKNGIELFTPLEIVSIDCKDEKIEAVYNACVEFIEWWNKN